MLQAGKLSIGGAPRYRKVDTLPPDETNGNDENDDAVPEEIAEQGSEGECREHGCSPRQPGDGGAPDTQNLPHWAEPRGPQEDAQPITKADVSTQNTINGICLIVSDGHLWAFLTLNLAGQAKTVSNNMPPMHGLDV